MILSYLAAPQPLDRHGHHVSSELLDFAIDFAIAEDIGVLTLRRPEVLNALDIPLGRELEALFFELR
jgi:hypothetical protein